MARASRAALVALGSLAALATVLAASGWLYLLRPTFASGRPSVGNALPLDELPHRSAVPGLLFVAVWGLAAVVLATIARAVRAERLTAALLLALGVGLVLYLEAGISIVVVRQIAAETAFQRAGALRAVYVPAVLAGLAGALVARERSRAEPRARLVLACFVAAAGLLGVLDAILPAHSRTLLAGLAPRAEPLVRTFGAPLGLALVYSARGLSRGRRRAWQLAVLVLAASTVFHVLHTDRGAIATGLLLLGLVARRGDFAAPGDPAAKPRLVRLALLFVVAIYAYGLAALWVHRLDTDQGFSVGFALRETTRALAGLSIRGSAHLSDPVGTWFGPSVLVLGLGAAFVLLRAWLAPWRFRHRQEQEERERAEALVRSFGTDTLAPFVLRADKSYFFAADGNAFLAYRVVGGVAIVSGDPIGDADAFDGLVGEFIGFARARDWRIAVLGASEQRLDLYRAHGLNTLYHGHEAVIDTARFRLDGRAVRKVRQSVSRLERAGYAALVKHPGELEPELRVELEAIAREWRGSQPQRGFVMAIDSLFRLPDDAAVFVLGIGPDGAPAGFLHFAIAGDALSLSSMPRRSRVPNGFNEWLVCEAVAWAREQGFRRVSLNFSPFAALLAPEAPLPRLARVERRALLVLKGRFQLDNLLVFNRKFLPAWQRRFVVYEHVRDLPRVSMAALAAEAYLPFSGRRRR
jgi:lysyl-tRNA synthetase class 2